MSIVAKSEYTISPLSDGSKGDAGRGVVSITPEYYLSTSKTTQSGGSWVTTPPTWVSGKYLWTRSKIVYSNPSGTEYTTPVVSSEWEAVNEIQVGGRNYFISKDYSSENNYQIITKTDEVFKGQPVYHAVKKSTGTPPTTIGKIDILKGETYTASMWVRHKFPVSKSYSKFLFYTSKQLSGSTGKTYGEWEHLTVTYTNDTDEDILGVNLYYYPASNTDDETYFSCPKLEKGNKATDWTAAPEDIDASISAAQSAANNAQSSANSALSTLQDISSDNKLTPVEKKEVKREWDAIVAEKPKIMASAANYTGVSTTAYEGTYTTLSNYLSPLLSDMTTTTNITGATLRTNFTSYYSARQDVVNAIAAKVKATADSADEKAQSAIDDIADIFSDSRVTPDEKQKLLMELRVIRNEREAITLRAAEMTPVKMNDADTFPDKYQADVEVYVSTCEVLEGMIERVTLDLTTTSDAGVRDIQQTIADCKTKRDTVEINIGIESERRLNKLYNWKDAVDAERATMYGFMQVGKVFFSENEPVVYGLAIGENINQKDGEYIRGANAASVVTPNDYSFYVKGSRTGRFSNAGLETEAVSGNSMTFSVIDPSTKEHTPKWVWSVSYDGRLRLKPVR